MRRLVNSPGTRGLKDTPEPGGSIVAIEVQMGWVRTRVSRGSDPRNGDRSSGVGIQLDLCKTGVKALTETRQLGSPDEMTNLDFQARVIRRRVPASAFNWKKVTVQPDSMS